MTLKLTIHTKMLTGLIVALLVTSHLTAQVNLNFESGSKPADQALGWEFGGISYISSNTITGSYSGQTQQLSNPNANGWGWIKSPWMDPGTDSIKLNVKLSSANGTYRKIRVHFIPFDLTADYFQGAYAADSLEWTYPTTSSTSTYAVSFAMPSAIANSTNLFKVMIFAQGSGGNSRNIFDDITISGTRRAIIVPTVWNDVNNNGLQDSGEPEISGAIVRLKNATTNANIQVQTTNADGKVAFLNVQPNKNIYLEFKRITNRHTYASPNQGSNDLIDSDANGTLGRTDTFVVDTGEFVTKYDGGFLVPGTITSYMWTDANNNGIQDLGESPIVNVRVRLRNASTNVVVGSQFTNASGLVSFASVEPFKNYYLQFSKPTISSNFTSINQGTDDELDSDVSNTGVTVNFQIGSGEISTTWDAGIGSGSLIARMEAENAEPAISVYPNPANESFRVNITSGSNGNGSIAIYDLSGKLVSEQSCTLTEGLNNITLSSASLQDGLYMVSITAEGKQSMHKLTVIH